MVRKCQVFGQLHYHPELDRPTDPMAVRLFVLQAQYRKPIDFTDEAVQRQQRLEHTKEGLLLATSTVPGCWKRSRGAEDLRSPHPHLLSHPTPRSCERMAVDDDLNFRVG